MAKHSMIAKATGDSFNDISASVNELSVCYSFWGDGFTWFDKLAIAASMLEKEADKLAGFFGQEGIQSIKGAGMKGCLNGANAIQEMASEFKKRIGEIEGLYNDVVSKVCSPIESACKEFAQKAGEIEDGVKNGDFSVLSEEAHKVVSAVNSGGRAAALGNEVSKMVEGVKELVGIGKSGKVGTLPKVYNKVFSGVENAIEILERPDLFADAIDILEKMYTLISGIDDLLGTYAAFGKFGTDELAPLSSLPPAVARILFNARMIANSL